MSRWQNSPGLVCQKPGGIFNNGACAGNGPPWAVAVPRGERGSPGVPPPPGPCPRPARAASCRDALGSHGPRGQARGERCCGARALPRPAVADTGTLTLAWKRELVGLCSAGSCRWEPSSRAGPCWRAPLGGVRIASRGASFKPWLCFALVSISSPSGYLRWCAARSAGNSSCGISL